MLPQSHCFGIGAEPPVLTVLQAGPAGHLPQTPYLIQRKGKQAEREHSADCLVWLKHPVPR